MLVTSVKIKQNPTNKFAKSEPCFLFWLCLSRCVHYIHWRSLLIRIVEKPINNPAGIARLAIIVASLIPYIILSVGVGVGVDFA